MPRLTIKQREEPYDRCKGDADFPLCNICNLQIFPGQKWHASHNPFLPKALGGQVDGIAHERCNLRHARDRDVPLIAKNKRRRQKHIGAWQSQRPMLGSIASGWKHFVRGGWARR